LPLIQLLYRSRSMLEPLRALSHRTALLSQAERLNRANGITGCLAFDDDYFVQILEGEPRDVDATILRIRRDRRHKEMGILLTRPIRTRAFADWSMTGFELDSSAAAGPSSGFSPQFLGSVETMGAPQLLLLLMDLADRKRMAARVPSPLAAVG
jgi:Sensors of blue-light using FAD